MSCALCPEYHFCEIKKSALDKNAIFIVHGMIWGCNSEIDKIDNEHIVTTMCIYA